MTNRDTEIKIRLTKNEKKLIQTLSSDQHKLSEKIRSILISRVEDTSDPARKKVIALNEELRDINDKILNLENKRDIVIGLIEKNAKEMKK